MDIPKLDIQKANLYKFVPCPTPLADGDSHSFIFLWLACQFAANGLRDLYHIMSLKTAFLQGEAYDEARDVVCRL